MWYNRLRVAKVIAMDACMLVMYDSDGEIEGCIVYGQA